MIYNFHSLAPKIKICEVIENNGKMKMKITFKGGLFQKDQTNIKNSLSWNGEGYEELERRLFVKYGIPATGKELLIENMSDSVFKKLSKHEEKGIILVQDSPRYEMMLRDLMTKKIQDMSEGKDISFPSKTSFQVSWLRGNQDTINARIPKDGFQTALQAYCLDRSFNISKYSKQYMKSWRDSEGLPHSDIMKPLKFKKKNNEDKPIILKTNYKISKKGLL